MATRNTKYFYPPRPGNGAGTFSDDIVGLQTVTGGGLTQGNFEFTTNVVEKVNRTFNIGAFSNTISLNDLNINSLTESELLLGTQFRVYPKFDVSQVLNFSMYGSLSKRLSVSVTKIINYFPAAIDVLYRQINLTTGATAENILYDSINDETYFEINVDRLHNPFDIDYTDNSTRNLGFREIEVSKYRNLYNTYLSYIIQVSGLSYTVESFSPSQSFTEGTIAFYVSGSPFGKSATTYYDNILIRPNETTVNKVFDESFDEIEKFLLNRLINPEYTALFQVPQQNDFGQFYTNYQPVTWPKDGTWNLDIRSIEFDTYIEKLQSISENLDEFKTNLISRFLVSGSLKDFDTLGQKVEKIFQIYGRSFDQIKQFIDALAYMNSVHYIPTDDIPSQLLYNLSRTLGWSSNFSPITNENFLDSVFGNNSANLYPGLSTSQTPTELNYQYYRNLILNSAYLFKSKGTRRSVEFIMRLIGAPESLIEFNECVYLADQKINMEYFNTQYAQISGGTYIQELSVLSEGDLYKIKGQTFTAFTTEDVYESVSISRIDYPVDDEGYPKSPLETEEMFFQKGAGWYQTTPQHRSPDEVQITGLIYTGQNYDIQTQLQPFTYGQLYLDIYRQFPYMREGFKLRRIVDNNKSWLETDDRIRVSTQADYNAYYFVDNEKLVINAKNVELNLNPGQGLLYDVWDESVKYDYPIPESGFSVNYPVPGGVDSTFVNPEPKKKTFFEFAQTFWLNMINTRNRQFISDGKTGGYPTLQSIFWKYIESEQTVGIPNNKYTYQKLIDYVQGMGPYWTKLVEQMIPATTIWTSGVKFENSILHKQKFVYRRQRGCQFVPTLVNPCQLVSSIFDYSCAREVVDFSIYPWLNGDATVSNFSSILNNRLDAYLLSQGLTLNDCILSSLKSTWFVDVRLSNNVLIQQQFYVGYGITDVPTNELWKTSITNSLPQLTNYSLGYNLDGNLLTVYNLTMTPFNIGENFSVNVGINLEISCTNGV
jgi:hypothetical protein